MVILSNNSNDNKIKPKKIKLFALKKSLSIQSKAHVFLIDSLQTFKFISTKKW